MEPSTPAQPPPPPPRAAGAGEAVPSTSAPPPPPQPTSTSAAPAAPPQAPGSAASPPVSELPAAAPDALPVAHQPPPSPPAPPRGGEKDIWQKSQKFEELRSAHFGGQLQTNSLYWKSFVAIIDRNRTSNARVLTYAEAKVAVLRAYSNELLGIGDKINDLKPGTTAAIKAKERAAAAKSKKKVKGTGKAGEKDEGEAPPKGALEYVCVMEEETAERVWQAAQDLQHNVIDKVLKEMNRDLGEKFQAIVAKGNACLVIVQECEKHVTAAFAHLKGKMSTGADPAARQGSGASASAEEAHDFWALDMNYRVAASQQALVWAHVRGELAKLFNEMKDLEVNRRNAIKMALERLVQAQDELYRGLQPLKDPVLLMLGRINADPRALDAEIRNAMRGGVADIESSERQSKKKDSAAQPAANLDGPPEPTSGEFMKSLSSPLESPFIRRMTLLEWRKEGMLSSKWQHSLGVLTHDGFLQLFDLPKSLTKDIGKKIGKSKARVASPTTDVAFKALVPCLDVEAALAALLKKKEMNLLGSDIGVPVPPSITLNVRFCDSRFKPEGAGASDCTFEVTEITKNEGMSRMVRDFNQRQVLLRGANQSDMVDWVVKLQQIRRKALEDMKPGEPQRRRRTLTMGCRHSRVFNFNRTVKSYPGEVFYPSTESEIHSIVTAAARAGRRLKVAGPGHTWSDFVKYDTGEWVMSLRNYNRCVNIDTHNMEITCQAGITLEDMINNYLIPRRLALVNLTSIEEQCLGGVIATNSHGSSNTADGLGDQALAFKVMEITKHGATTTVRRGDEYFTSLQCHLGVVALVLEVTLKVRDEYFLGVKTANLGTLSNLTTERIISQTESAFDVGYAYYSKIDTVVEVVKDYIAPVPTSRRPGITDLDNIRRNIVSTLVRPFLNTALEKWISGRALAQDGQEDIWRVVLAADDSRGRYNYTAENPSAWCVPLADVQQAFRIARDVMRLFHRQPTALLIRFSGGSPALLSPTFSSDTTPGVKFVYLSVQMQGRRPNLELVRTLQEQMLRIGARPHWGKLHCVTRADLDFYSIFPRENIDTFLAAKSKFDPHGLMSNHFADRVLWPHGRPPALVDSNDSELEDRAAVAGTATALLPLL